jgi:hypothetical protein
MMVVIAVSEILVIAGTETNSNCPIRVDAWLSDVEPENGGRSRP